MKFTFISFTLFVRILKTLLIYIAGCWGVLQAIDFFASRYNWNSTVFDLSLILAISGLPFVAVRSGYHSFFYERKIGKAEASIYLLVFILAVWTNLTFYTNTNTSKGKPDEAKSVAVLPFADLSPAHDQEYFSDGVAAEILNSLSQIKDLKVPGHTSSFRFKGMHEDLKKIGELLSVNNVLDGTVRKYGNKVIITVQLTDVHDGYTVWSQKFERTLDDVFAIQEEIAKSVAEKLKVTLLVGERIQVGKGLSQNKEAYDAYLRGKFFWDQRDLIESEKNYLRAIELDSTFAHAYAGLAETYVVFPFFGYGTPHEYMPKAQHAAYLAMHLDSSLCVPYLVIAFKNESYDWNADVADKYYKLAIAKNPTYAPSHYWYGHYLINLKSDLQNGVKEMKKSTEIEPLGSIHYFNYGFSLYCLRNYNEAITTLHTSIELKENSNAYLYLGNSYLASGKLEEARKAYQKSSEMNNGTGSAYLIYFLMRENKVNEANEVFQQIIERSKKRYIGKSSLAMAASFLGKKDLAHQYFLEAINTRDVWLPSLVNDPLHIPSNVFSDQRNVALMDRYFSSVKSAEYRKTVGN